MIKGIVLRCGFAVFASAAAAESRLEGASRTKGPRNAFLSDSVLFSAQVDAYGTGVPERTSLIATLDKCSGHRTRDLVGYFACDKAIHEHLYEYRSARSLDRLLDATGFMMALARHSAAVGRAVEPGIPIRLEQIRRGLSQALDVPVTSENVSVGLREIR